MLQFWVLVPVGHGSHGIWPMTGPGSIPPWSHWSPGSHKGWGFAWGVLRLLMWVSADPWEGFSDCSFPDDVLCGSCLLFSRWQKRPMDQMSREMKMDASKQASDQCCVWFGLSRIVFFSFFFASSPYSSLSFSFFSFF